MLLTDPGAVRARIVLPVLLLRAGPVGDVRHGDGHGGAGLGAHRAPVAISGSRRRAASACSCRGPCGSCPPARPSLRDRRWRLPTARPMRGSGSLLSAAIVVAAGRAVGILHASTHAAGASIIGSSGAVTRPSAETLGVAFVALGLVGAILAFRAAAGRPERAIASRGVAVLLRRHHSPGAGAGGLRRPRRRAKFLHAVQDGVSHRAPVCRPRRAGAGDRDRRDRARGSASVPRSLRSLGTVAAAPSRCSIAALLASGRMPVKRQQSPISESALAAGLWARETRFRRAASTTSRATG